MRLSPFILSLSLILSGCASIVSPSGGPKDKLPPELESSTPANNSKNFRGKTVELTFNEALKLKTPKEEIIISPSVGREIDYRLKNNKVYITPKNGWKDSTTYSLLFREGIQDITEGNIPPNLRLAFSTGPEIDTLHISGRVTYLLKGNNAEKITVAIYQSDTFNIFKHTPSYLTKTSKTGVFRLDNLKKGQYKIYAFDDKNKNLKVESRNERFGFIRDTIHLESNIDSLHIGLISLDTRPLKITTVRKAGALTRLRFSKPVTNYKVASTSPIQYSLVDTPDELVFWNPLQLHDSVNIHLTAIDSLGNTVDSTFYIKRNETRTVRDSFKWSPGQFTIDPETGSLSSTIKFNKPLKSIQHDSLFIELDTTSVFRIKPQDLIQDTARNEIRLTTILEKKIFEGDADPRINIHIGKGFLISMDNDSTKAMNDQPQILWAETTGVLILQAQTKEPNYIVQLLKADGQVVYNFKNMTKQTIKQLMPNDYQIRIIIDENANGEWDAGNPYKQIEPEKVVHYITTEKKRNFPIRANWELGPLILKF